MQKGNHRLGRPLLFSLSRPILFLAVALSLAFGVVSCSLSNERVAVFSGSIQVVKGSDTLATDLSEEVGLVIYDKEVDGIFDDTVVFYGDETGEFTGILTYEFPLNITSPRFQKHVQLILPSMGVDTFLTIDVYEAADQEQVIVNRWEPLILANH